MLRNTFDCKETCLGTNEREGTTIRITTKCIISDITVGLKIIKTTITLKETTIVISNTSRRSTEIEATIGRGSWGTTRTTMTVISSQTIRVRGESKGLGQGVKVMNTTTSEETLL